MDKPSDKKKGKHGIGVYIHYPFCIKKCPYCDFNSVNLKDNNWVERYLEAVSKELDLRADGHVGLPVSTIYFGGGTPSLMAPKSIRVIIKNIKYHHNMSGNNEVTLEVNPGTVSPEKIKEFFCAGVNRLSIGVQSFNDNELETLGRVHSAKDALDALGSARHSRFDSFGVDLIYGVPGQTVKTFMNSVKTAVGEGAKHLSLYALTLSEETEMFKNVQDGLKLPADDVTVECYLEAARYLGSEGFVRYEISNWSVPGMECRHNMDCWKGHYYIGIGAGAHGYKPLGHSENGARYSNVDNIENYIEEIESGKLAETFIEELTPIEKARENIYLGLRTRTGADFDDLNCLFSATGRRDELDRVLGGLLEEGLITQDKSRINLTIQGGLFADAVALRLI